MTRPLPRVPPSPRRRAVVNCRDVPLRPRARWSCGDAEKGDAIAVWLLLAEVLTTILSLFCSVRFKEPYSQESLTTGFLSGHHRHILQARESDAYLDSQESAVGAVRIELIVFRCLGDLIHAIRCIFIWALTFFVSRDRQTRLLEGITFFATAGATHGAICRRSYGTRIRGGCHRRFRRLSMIGLTIRTWVIVLLLAPRRPRRSRMR